VDETERRKTEQLRICLERDVQAKSVKTGFDDVKLVHRCLPEIDLDAVNLSTTFLNHQFQAPLMISAMTGGSKEAARVNANLAEAADMLGIGMCVGSQRAALENPKLEQTFTVAREKAPKAFISANIGFSELLHYGLKDIQRAVDMIEADALTIHLNPLQESLQHEAKPRFKGIGERIQKLTPQLHVPVIVKETGAGVAKEDAVFLEKAGVKAIDVAGAGGTSWSAVEHYRALEAGDKDKAKIAGTFWDWGIPTAISLVEVRSVTSLEIVASGGLGNGVDVVKALYLGARLGGLATALLDPANVSADAVIQRLNRFIREIKTAMTLVGAKSVDDLRVNPLLIVGTTAEWMRQRGLSLERR